MTIKDQIAYVRRVTFHMEQSLTAHENRELQLECIHAIIESLEIVEAVNELRENEGASVTIPSDNPEPETPETQMYVTVCDRWTGVSGWQDESFEAKTLLEALRAAVTAKKEREE